MTTAADFARAVNPNYKEKIVCPGTGQPPRITIQNDWWVGEKGVCPHCGRSFSVKNGKIPRHKTRQK